jgi:hypothetical protein
MAAQFDQAGEAVDGDIRDNMGGVYNLPFTFDQALIHALPDNLLKDLSEFRFSQPLGPEAADGGIIRHIFIHGQAEEVLIGEVNAGVFNDMPI